MSAVPWLLVLALLADPAPPGRPEDLYPFRPMLYAGADDLTALKRAWFDSRWPGFLAEAVDDAPAWLVEEGALDAGSVARRAVAILGDEVPESDREALASLLQRLLSVDAGAVSVSLIDLALPNVTESSLVRFLFNVLGQEIPTTAGEFALLMMCDTRTSPDRCAAMWEDAVQVARGLAGGSLRAQSERGRLLVTGPLGGEWYVSAELAHRVGSGGVLGVATFANLYAGVHLAVGLRGSRAWVLITNGDALPSLSHQLDQALLGNAVDVLSACRGFENLDDVAGETGITVVTDIQRWSEMLLPLSQVVQERMGRGAPPPELRELQRENQERGLIGWSSPNVARLTLGPLGTRLRVHQHHVSSLLSLPGALQAFPSRPLETSALPYGAARQIWSLQVDPMAATNALRLGLAMFQNGAEYLRWHPWTSAPIDEFLRALSEELDGLELPDGFPRDASQFVTWVRGPLVETEEEVRLWQRDVVAALGREVGVVELAVRVNHPAPWMRYAAIVAVQDPARLARGIDALVDRHGRGGAIRREEIAGHDCAGIEWGNELGVGIWWTLAGDVLVLAPHRATLEALLGSGALSRRGTDADRARVREDLGVEPGLFATRRAEDFVAGQLAGFPLQALALLSPWVALPLIPAAGVLPGGALGDAIIADEELLVRHFGGTRVTWGFTLDEDGAHFALRIP